MHLFYGKRYELSHISFSLLFTAALFMACNALNVDALEKWFRMPGGVDYAAFFAYLFVGWVLFLVIFLLFAHRWTIKPVALVFIVLSALATYFIDKYNIAIDRTMVENVFHTDPTEVSGLLTIHMLPYVAGLIVLPIWLLSRVQVRFGRPAVYLSKSLLTLVLMLGLGTGLAYSQYDGIHRAGNISDKYIIHMLVPVNYVRSVASVVQRAVSDHQRSNSTPTTISGRVTAEQDLVVVLAIGETSRQQNFSLYGYAGNPTNPILSQDPDIRVLNGKASIGTTILALQKILSKGDVKLVSATSQMGVDTSCYVNFKLYDNCDAVGEIATHDCGHEGQCYDEDLIPLLADSLRSYRGGQRFLVLHAGGGSHGPLYYKRHPPEFQQFRPQCLDADVINQCTPEELINSYDNTILYVDYVVGGMLRELDASGLPYVFIYLSDHGESLLEGGRIFHGMPPGVALPPEQSDVPLLVKASVPLQVEQREEYPQSDVFDTVLNLLNIESGIVDPARVFLRRDETQRAEAGSVPPRKSQGAPSG